MQLDALFKPKSIAVIGASDKPTIGRRLIVSLERIGFAGVDLSDQSELFDRARPPMLAEHRRVAGNPRCGAVLHGP